MFGTVVSGPGNSAGATGLEAMAAACNDLWRNGFAGERLVFERE